MTVENRSAHSVFGLETANMRAPAGILVSISCFSSSLLNYCLQVFLALGTRGLALPATLVFPQPETQERNYVGVLSDFDYRRWTVERVEGEVARILKVEIGGCFTVL